MLSWLGDKLREQDLFAQNVTLTMNGQETVNTKIGGSVTILVVLGVLIQSVFALLELLRNPSYNQFPTTYNYEYSKEIHLDFKTNMMAYAFHTFFGAEYAFQYLRVAFYSNGSYIPAVLCQDYFADQILAEANGQSNSTFYTDTYSTNISTRSSWVCPDLGNMTITEKENMDNIVVYVLSCNSAKTKDPDFLPDQVCKSET